MVSVFTSGYVWVHLALIFFIFPVDFVLFIHCYRLTGSRVLAYRRLVSSIGRAPDCCAGGREFNTGRTNTQGLKINWEEYASFLNIKKWLDILVFSDRDE